MTIYMILEQLIFKRQIFIENIVFGDFNNMIMKKKFRQFNYFKLVYGFYFYEVKNTFNKINKKSIQSIFGVQKPMSLRSRSRMLLNNPSQSKVQRVRFQGNISEAETSEDERGERGRKVMDRKSAKERKDVKTESKDIPISSSRGNNTLYSSSSRFDNSQSSTTRQSSAWIRNNSIKDLSNQRKQPYVSPARVFPPPTTTPKCIDIQDDDKESIIYQLRFMDFSTFKFKQIKEKFIKICGRHVKFVGMIPEASTSIGHELIRNGEFHSKWKEVILRDQSIDKEDFCENYFVSFAKKVTINVQTFMRAFKSSKQKVQQSSNIELKRYRSSFEQQRSRSTTKIDCMLLYQQAREEMRIDELQQNVQKKVEKAIQQWHSKLLAVQLQPKPVPLCETDLMFETEQSVIEKWNDLEEIQRRQQAIEQLEKQRIRERSPISNRFRMMHECQTNSRRMQVEMACIFLQIEKFYYLQDLEIVQVEETIFSPNQEIVVLKAYVMDYDPKVGMMHLQPKVKNLICVYKFCGLPQLIRLEKTYGRFDGIVVYPESFDIQLYISSNKGLTLLKQGFKQEIKKQVNLIQEEKQRDLEEGEKIDY